MTDGDVHEPTPVLDAHTHLSGSESGESTENIVGCMDACNVQKAFVFAPLIDVHSSQLTAQDIDTIRNHNDYCADVCSGEPERLLGFCVLNPTPKLADGSLEESVKLMVTEAQRCHRELGLRGAKLVPSRWYPNDERLVPLYRTLADLGMYVAFHAGIFLDGHEGSYCRPAFYEGIRDVPELKAQLAHMAWPWVDECVAVLEMETQIHGRDNPSKWQMKADLSFGPPDEWQLPTWQRAMDNLPHAMLCYASDVFWPCTPERYREQYLQPQLGLFEVSVTQGRLAPEGSPERARLRHQIFHENAWQHWRAAVRQPQRPRAAKQPVATPRGTSQDHPHQQANGLSR